MITALTKNLATARRCEKLLYFIVLTLVFEGITRKFIPTFNIVIFLLKDVLCIIGLLQISSIILPVDMVKFRSIWITLIILFLPLLFRTAFLDVVLALFAAKQYLLYLIIVIIAVVAFPPEREKNFRSFLFYCSLLIAPTTIVAVIQNGLPSTHWINRSVGGESLAGFSAAGRLRVGSTFSFTAQYSWFLVAEAFILATSFFLSPEFNNRVIRRLLPFIFLALLVMLITGAFMTGGRSAVLGCGAVFALGIIFIGIKRPVWFFSKGVPILAIGAASLFVLRQINPEFFIAYDTRSKGTTEVSHNEEIEGRVLAGFTDWTIWFWDQSSTSIFLGNGLGVMSNGSSQISDYAAIARDDGYWTEGDVPTTFWEGGFYLGFIWYGLRLSMIFMCFRLWMRMNNRTLSAAASVPLAYVIIQGIVATLAMHPPMAIWWWLAISIIIFIFRFEQYRPTAPPVLDV